MIAPPSIRAQRGATLIVGLIMLVLITLMVTSAFMLSTSNLRAVGNMQFRNEAIAAANRAIERKVGSDLAIPTAEPGIEVDIDNDGDPDYIVDIAMPECVRASIASLTPGSSIQLSAAMQSSAFWSTLWDIDATVNDGATGASVRVRQGVRVVLTQAQKDAACT